ncbi:hypothetical protein GCM10010187_10980 [Actinomadura coerulea]|nr:hypothetical protein GCM10010187_10980 [Actinomadura coerulea]
MRSSQSACSPAWSAPLGGAIAAPCAGVAAPCAGAAMPSAGIADPVCSPGIGADWCSLRLAMRSPSESESCKPLLTVFNQVKRHMTVS